MSGNSFKILIYVEIYAKFLRTAESKWAQPPSSGSKMCKKLDSFKLNLEKHAFEFDDLIMANKLQILHTYFSQNEIENFLIIGKLESKECPDERFRYL